MNVSLKKANGSLHKTGPSIAIIIPVYNEHQEIPSLLEHLSVLKTQGFEIILVDASEDTQLSTQVKSLGFQWIHSQKGRALQMNIGARKTSAEVLLFLHADTRLPKEAFEILQDFELQKRFHWGRFNVRIEGLSKGLPLVAFLMNLRSKWTSIATGDQAIFIKRKLFQQIDGFKPIPLMEDIDLSKRLRKSFKPLCLTLKVTTSGRRWDERGCLATICLMWQLRFRYWLGETPETLAHRYR